MGVYLEKVTVRLFACDTWESRTKNKEEKVKGLEAKAIAKGLVEGKEVELESMELDKYGRVLGKITCEKGDLAEYLRDYDHAQRVHHVVHGHVFILLPGVYVPQGDKSLNLKVGFPLRCFQRLSVRNVATRRCD